MQGDYCCMIHSLPLLMTTLKYLSHHFYVDSSMINMVTSSCIHLNLSLWFLQ